MIIVQTAISVRLRTQKNEPAIGDAREESSDRLSSIKTINLMNLKRIKGKIPAEKQPQKEMKLFMRSALRFQLIRNYVILIDLIRLISYADFNLSPTELCFNKPMFFVTCSTENSCCKVEN
jgi:hypothetical protein